MSGGNPSTRLDPNGFTLVECLASMAVLAIIATAGIPSFSDAIDSWKLTTAANETLAAWQVARVESIKSNRSVVICASENQDAAVPTCSDHSSTGWVAFSDLNGNWSHEAEEQVLRTARLPRGVTVFAESSSPLAAAFHPSGFARTQDREELLSLSAVLCLPGSRAPIRRVSVQAGSKMTVEKIESTTGCPN